MFVLGSVLLRGRIKRRGRERDGKD